MTNSLTGKDAVVLDSKQIGKVDETEAKNKVDTAAREVRNKINGIVNQCLSTIYSDVKGKLEEAGQKSIDVLKTNKDRFFKNIKESTSGALNNMEQELKDKKVNLQLLEEALNELTKIGNKL